MGADLYIESICQRKEAMYRAKFEEAVRMRDSMKSPYNQEYQELVEYYFDKRFAVGYYRDSYNNSNLLCLGGRITSAEDALAIVDAWLDTPFEGGRHCISLDFIPDAEAILTNPAEWHPEPR